MMHKVMIIDDDVPMLKVLEQMIDWEALQLHLVCKSYSSVKALHSFQELSPDIVITDIGLPKKSGIELAELFMQLKPNVRIIFLTCHEDFHYAQQAVKLNVDDYLIKDQLTKEQLQQSLLKSVQLLQPKDQSGSEKMSNYTIDLYKQSLFRRIMDGVRSEEILTHASQLSINWGYPYFMVGTVNLVYSAFEQFYKRKDIPSLLYAVYNIAVELSASYEGITAFLEQKNIVVIYNFRSNLALSDEGHIQNYMEHLYDQSVQCLKLRLRMLIFTDKADLPALRTIYNQSIGELNAFYEPEDIITTNRKTFTRVIFSPQTEQFLDPYKPDIERALVKNAEADIAAVLNKILQAAEEYRLPPQSFARSLTFLLQGLDMAFASRRDEDCYYYIGASTSAADVATLMQRRLGKLLLSRGKRQPAAVQEPKLQVVQAYIDEHLYENITSIDMANHLYLNPSYFSRYFKLKTGVNFTDYVHQYKMEIASRILKTSSQTLESISMMLGYSDRPYFSKVFKKYIGMTPSEYQQRHGSANNGR